MKRNFAAYAQMEAANVVLVPGLALWLGWPRTMFEVIAMFVSVIAVAGLLVVGAVFWRAIDRRLKLRDRQTFASAMAIADVAQRPMAIAVFGSGIAVVVAFVAEGATRSVIAAATLSLLAALEFVNYYHRQLQIFDNPADFKRLLATWQFKRAHLARELAAFRERRR